METLRLGTQDYLVKTRFDGATLRRAIRYAIQRNDALIERCGRCRIRLDKLYRLPLSAAAVDISFLYSTGNSVYYVTFPLASQAIMNSR
jgi:hypothetical protein